MLSFKRPSLFGQQSNLAGILSLEFIFADVLLMIRDKYREAQSAAHPDEAKQDLQLSLEVLERLASSGSPLSADIRSR